MACVALSPASAAEPDRVSLRDGFRLGSGGVLCSAQSLGRDPALRDMFDRGYAVVCRDAAAPVGRLYVLRSGRDEPEARLSALRAAGAVCGPAARTELEGVGTVQAAQCTASGTGLGYRVYSWKRGNRVYVAEGLAGYDSALRLGLRTLVADRAVPGEIEVAITEAGDPAAFARVQAGALDPARALAEGYRRNNSGAYAEAAEFIATVIARQPAGSNATEALLNQALQQSNLGNVGEAETMLAEAADLAGADPVLSRMHRNYRAMHLLNRQLPEAALDELARTMAAASPPRSPSDPVIDAGLAARLNAESAALRQLGATDGSLLPEEKAQILDAQAQHLRGTILRLAKRPAEAAGALQAALAGLDAVRNGRVISTLWMRSQVHGELAALAEVRGDGAEAERQHRTAVALLETDYPGSAALLSAQGRLAGYYARLGRNADARALYRAIVEASSAGGTASPTLRQTLSPYFALLAREASDPAAVAELFKASQLLVRPGVAQTQAVLARELSGGSDEAARLFRQSVNLSREIERVRVEVARLPQPGDGADAARAAALAQQLDEMEKAQVATQARLAEFPRYRVVSGGAMELTELQQALRPGEAYYKMTIVGEDGYALLATPSSAKAWKIGASAAELEAEVDALRATISVVENGQVLTYPFDVELAHKLYAQLFGPAQAEIAAARHLIFEPDGAMLRLPPNLLVTDRSGVEAYLAKARQPDNDGFDFTAVNWLGRERDVSTAVSARSFRDVRRAAPSRAAKEYLGFGENQPPVGAQVEQAAVRGLLGETSSCAWPVQAWARPISAAELHAAGKVIAARGEPGTEIVTGAAFSDSAIKARDDLGEYRILHFATHGLVSAPRPECAARPALMTSFGGADSDGLLSFGEIYDLKLDADLVILSACDTAGKASLAATREAGIRTGGDFALDGLVRAFVGAGGRSVIASHWPVPDDYDATNRLISGLFKAERGTATATALRQAQAALMANAETSHPYYWSGFAIVGDGSAPVLPAS